MYVQTFKKCEWDVRRRVLVCATSMFILPFSATIVAASLPSPTVHSADVQVVNQNVRYEGTVVDATTGEPIIGANIVLKKNKNVGVITDMDGRFTINASRGSIITVTFLGYKSVDYTLGSSRTVKIVLGEDSKALDEVVVTAFGVGQKKESVVGAITQVRPNELRVPSANLTNSFAGRLAGVVSFQRTGEPGADGSTFYIRGISTLAGGARNPLIIIDGVEASAGDLNAIDPEVIDGFSILKDATATAMYGTRGANGVVIVTTKSGANLEKAAVSVRLEGNLSTPTKLPEFADAGTYMQMYNEAVKNYNNGAPSYSEDFINGVLSGADPYRYPNVDWYNELFKNTAFNQKANVNVRGGNKRLDYFVNVNVSNEEGMLRGRSKEFYSYDNNINIRRYTFQNNINLNLSSTSKLSLNLAAELRDTHGPSVGTDGLFGSVMNGNPVDYPIMYPVESVVGENGLVNDFIKWGIYNGGNKEALTNPMAELTKGYSDSFASTIRANLRFTQKLDFITKGLSFGALASFKNWSSTSTTRSRGYNRYVFSKMVDVDGVERYNITPSTTEEQRTLGTSTSTTGDRSFYFQATLNYDRTFGEKHNVSAMLLYNQDEFNLNNPYNDNADTRLINSLPKRKLGFAGRLSYDYDRKYLIELNMGYNGAENFVKGHRFGFFPSVAVGYNIAQEKWFEPLKSVVNNLKLRASYGLVGNSDAGTRFVYLPIIDLRNGDRGFKTGDGESSRALNGPKYSRFSNENITWEVGYKSNFGIDLTLFNSLNLTFEYFNELRKNIFQQNNTIPQYMGAVGTEVWGNTGEVKNHGFEFSADYGKQVNKDFSVQFKGTFSFARNEVRKYAQAFSPDYPSTSIIGKSLDVNMGYLYAGHLFIDAAEVANSPTQQISGNVAAGDIKYVDIADINGKTDGLINNMDRVYMGYPRTPEIIYGFGPSFKYKKWDFSFFFQGVANTSLMMSGFHPFGTTSNRNVLKFIADDYWNSTNQNIYAAYPRLTQNELGNNTAASSYWLRDASFLKLKNIELGYSYKFMRLYVNATNVLTFSKFKYWDPEQGGGNGLKYPTQRVVNFGIQLSL